MCGVLRREPTGLFGSTRGPIKDFDGKIRENPE
jgi:hypothetical protein